MKGTKTVIALSLGVYERAEGLVPSPSSSAFRAAVPVDAVGAGVDTGADSIVLTKADMLPMWRVFGLDFD